MCDLSDIERDIQFDIGFELQQTVRCNIGSSREKLTIRNMPLHLAFIRYSVTEKGLTMQQQQMRYQISTNGLSGERQNR